MLTKVPDGAILVVFENKNQWAIDETQCSKFTLKLSGAEVSSDDFSKGKLLQHGETVQVVESIRQNTTYQIGNINGVPTVYELELVDLFLRKYRRSGGNIAGRRFHGAEAHEFNIRMSTSGIAAIPACPF